MFRKANLKRDDEGAETWALLGLSAYVCPVCGAHLKETEPDLFICLNACHLGRTGKERFQATLIAHERRRKREE